MAEIRKLRKKLRQIEHLERLERDLIPEEYEKVSTKSDIRELLNDKLVKLEKEDENIEVINRMMADKSNKGIAADVNESDQQVPAIMSSKTSNIKLLDDKSASENAESSTDANEGDITHTGNSSHNENGTSAVNNSCAGPSKQPAEGQLSSAVVPSVGTSSASVSSATSTSSMKKAKKQSSTAGVSGSCQWQDKVFNIKSLEGHNDQIFSVDMDDSLLISGSRDTMLKVWDCESGKEVRSMGGHTGGITSVVLIKKDEHVDSEASDGGYLGVTGSHDCSIKIWSLGDDNTLRSMYAYSPVLCLDRRKGNLVSGSESGKVELWDLEAGGNICSTRGDDIAVSCVKFKCEQIVSGSSVGTVKIWDTRQRSLMPAITSDSFNVPFAKKRKVHCLATTDNSIYWGDDGTNIKVLDIRVGKVRKLKNHLTEFGTTSAMIVHDSFLISSGYDLDKGTGYLNVRTLPDEEYAATLDDDVTSYISCLCCTDVRKEGVVCPRLCTGGSELKIWDQLSTNKVRKRTRADEDPSFITSKHLRRYSSGDPIDTESSDESDDEGRRDDSSDDDDESDRATSSNARQSWCTIS